MKLEDLLMSSIGLGALGAPPEMNPLTETDALQEAQLLGVRFDALSLTAGLLFELRTRCNCAGRTPECSSLGESKVCRGRVRTMRLTSRLGRSGGLQGTNFERVWADYASTC